MSRARTLFFLFVFGVEVVARTFGPAAAAGRHAGLEIKASVAASHTLVASPVSSDEDAGTVNPTKMRRRGQNLSSPVLILVECGFEHLEAPQRIFPHVSSRLRSLSLPPETPPPIRRS